MKAGDRIVMQNSILSQISFPGFLDEVQDGLYIVDDTCTIVFWNKAAEELTGFESSRVVGRNCMDRELLDYRTVLGENLCTEAASPVVRCMAGGSGGTVPHILLASTAAGRPLPISLSVGPLHGK